MSKHIAAKQRLYVLRLIHLSTTYQSPGGDQSVMVYSTDPAKAIIG
jgi:predicted transcriptional regulator